MKSSLVGEGDMEFTFKSFDECLLEVLEVFFGIKEDKTQKMNECGEQSAKADAGKLQLSLVPTQIIRDIAQVRMYGCEKYKDPDNWKKVECQRYVDALYRHFLAFVDDPYSVDEESGIPHYKHMACNMAFICEMMEGVSDDSRRAES